MKYRLGNTRVQCHGEYYIAHNATVIGDVELGDKASVWFNAVIRADVDKITIGAETNIQDGSVLHCDSGTPLHIGKGVTVGHKAMLHGCTIGDHCLIGINAVILNGAKIGNNCLIGASTLVPENMEIPDGSMVLGTPAKIVRQLSKERCDYLASLSQRYVDNAERYRSEFAVDDSK